MRLLVTNDDGLDSPGIKALAAAFGAVAEVIVVAPERPQSACSHAVTLHKPLRVRQVGQEPGVTYWTANGTPADCVIIGLDRLKQTPPDLVLSGINEGWNLGEDIIYSGTVAAAVEAALHRVPSMALSAAPEAAPNWPKLAQFSLELVRRVQQIELPTDTCLAVNFPPIEKEDPKGIIVSRPGRRNYPTTIEARVDPRGQPYYWLGVEKPEDSAEPRTDVWCVNNGYLSVTPLGLELTRTQAMEPLGSLEGSWV